MQRVTRRAYVKGLGVGMLGLLAAACGTTAPATSSATSAPAPAAPTVPPAPSAAAAPSAAPRPAASAAAPAASPSAVPAVRGAASTVRVTDIQITSAAGAYIAAERGYFADEGVNPTFVSSSAAQQVTDVVTGAADVCGSIINAQLYNALGRGLPLKMVADHGANLKNASAGGLVVRKDLVDSGQYKGAASLKGWKFAVGATQSTTDVVMDKFLSTAGLTLKDIDYTTLGFPEMVAAFASKALQAGYFQEPFTTIAVQQGTIWRGPIGYDIYPDEQVATVVFGKKLYSDRTLSLHYIRAYTRGVRDYVKALIDKDQAMFNIVVPILIKHTTVKTPALFKNAIPSGLRADPVPNVTSMKDDLTWFVQHGEVTKPLNLDQYLDLSFVHDAISQLGSVPQ